MKSRSTLVTQLARRENLTVRQLIERLAGGRGHRVFAGTPEQVADQLDLWFHSGAADGFNIMPPNLPGGLEDFVDQVVPELQRRGLFRTEYTGDDAARALRPRAARQPHVRPARRSMPHDRNDHPRRPQAVRPPRRRDRRCRPDQPLDADVGRFRQRGAARAQGARVPRTAPRRRRAPGLRRALRRARPPRTRPSSRSTGSRTCCRSTASDGARANNWHTDVTFVPAPPKATSLRGITIPPYGGNTLFADTAGAYRDLPEPLRNFRRHPRRRAHQRLRLRGAAPAQRGSGGAPAAVHLAQVRDRAPGRAGAPGHRRPQPVHRRVRPAHRRPVEHRVARHPAAAAGLRHASGEHDPLAVGSRATS